MDYYYYDRIGAERKKLVAAISEITGTESKYLGMPSMAYKIGDYTVEKDGTLCWPALNFADPDFIDKHEYLIDQLAERGFKGKYPMEDEMPEEDENPEEAADCIDRYV